MQQTITINIVDPSKAGDNLPQTGATFTNFLIEHPLTFALLVIIIAVAIAALLVRRAYLNDNQGGAHALKRRLFFILPLIILAPLVLISTSGSNSANSYAAVGTPLIDKVDPVTINIPQGETSATATFEFEVDPTSYSHGFDLQVQADAENSILPDDVSVAVDGVVVSDNEAAAIIHEWRQPTVDTTPLAVTVTVPADAPLGDSYALVKLDYVATDFVYTFTFQDPSLLSPANPLAVRFDPTPGTGACDAMMEVYGTGGVKPDTVEVIDTRNNEVYRVRKLKDNKCWMIDNLKLNLNGRTLTAADSDVLSALSLNTQSNSTGKTYSGDFQIRGGMTTDGTTSTAAGDQNYYAQADPSNQTWCANASNWQDSKTRCGYLYNFYTATAGSSSGLSGGSADYSICPAGWDLPTGGNTGASDFSRLDQAYGGSGAQQGSTPAQLATLWLAGGAFAGQYVGAYTNDIAANYGIHSYWWSSSVSNSANGYMTQATAQAIWPGSGSDPQIIGKNVRCVLK